MVKNEVIKKINNIFKEYSLNNVPSLYKETISDVVCELTDFFSDNLVNITLGGSCGKNNPVAGWSDIDLYVVLKSFYLDQIGDFDVSEYESKIHIGITFYTYDEVLNNLIDFKTRVMIYERTRDKVNPILFGSDIFPTITFDEIKRNDRLNFPNILHLYRRTLTEIIKNNKKFEKKQIKQLVLLLKMLLYNKDIYVTGYKMTFSRFSQYCVDNNFQLPAIINFDIIDVLHNLDNNNEKLVNFSLELLKFIENEKILGG